MNDLRVKVSDPAAHPNLVLPWLKQELLSILVIYLLECVYLLLVWCHHVNEHFDSNRSFSWLLV